MDYKCKNCNANLTHEDDFCPNCGKKVENNVAIKSSSEKISNDIKSNIKSVKTFQYIILVLVLVLLIFNIIYPSIINNNYEKQLPSISNYKTVYLSKLDPNKESFYTIEGNYIYVYQEDMDKTLTVYRFYNSSQYNSSNRELLGKATTRDLKLYFSDKISNELPTKTYFYKNFYIILIIVNLALIIITILLLIKIVRQVKDICRLLKKNHSKFIELNNKFQNDLISKQEFNNARQKLLNKLINNSNLLGCFFRFLY